MNRLIRTTCAIAAEDIGRERAGRIAVMAQRRYEKLCTENASDSIPSGASIRASRCMRRSGQRASSRRRRCGPSGNTSSAFLQRWFPICSGLSRSLAWQKGFPDSSRRYRCTALERTRASSMRFPKPTAMKRGSTSCDARTSRPASATAARRSHDAFAMATTRDTATCTQS